MNGKALGATGLRLTLRHQMIVVAYFAVLSAGLPRVFNHPAADVGPALARWILLASPWILGGLVWVFDRPGPQRDWTTAALLFSFYPSLAFYLDISAAMDAADTGLIPRPWTLAAFNTLIIGSSLIFFRRMRPAPCPTCGRRSLIPLVRLMGQSRRANKTRWCASCGGQFWRDRAGAWRVERRTTWANAPTVIAAVTADVETAPMNRSPAAGVS